MPTVGVALALVFLGGAAGKFVCGWLGARAGVLLTVLATAGGTAACILGVLALPLVPLFVLLPALGVMLNGTSSVLYGTVPELTPPDRAERAFALFYTGTIRSEAISPVLYGVLGDRAGAHWATAIVALVILPLAFALAPHLAGVREKARSQPDKRCVAGGACVDQQRKWECTHQASLPFPPYPRFQIPAPAQSTSWQTRSGLQRPTWGLTRWGTAEMYDCFGASVPETGTATMGAKRNVSRWPEWAGRRPAAFRLKRQKADIAQVYGFGSRRPCEALNACLRLTYLVPTRF